jgi:hypothetical protein
MRETKRITEFPKSGEAARVDARLRTVMVELFLPNFIGATNARQAGTWSEFARNTLTLFASADVLRDAIATAAYNVASGRPAFQIGSSGTRERSRTHLPSRPKSRLCRLLPVPPKLRAAVASHDVTMFQPTRPLLMWSSDPNWRARLNGSV